MRRSGPHTWLPVGAESAVGALHMEDDDGGGERGADSMNARRMRLGSALHCTALFCGWVRVCLQICVARSAAAGGCRRADLAVPHLTGRRRRRRSVPVRTGAVAPAGPRAAAAARRPGRLFGRRCRRCIVVVVQWRRRICVRFRIRSAVAPQDVQHAAVVAAVARAGVPARARKGERKTRTGRSRQACRQWDERWRCNGGCASTLAGC